MVLLFIGLLLAAAITAGATSPPGRALDAASTLRVNLSSTDVQYVDPGLEYESTGWQLLYAV